MWLRLAYATTKHRWRSMRNLHLKEWIVLRWESNDGQGLYVALATRHPLLASDREICDLGLAGTNDIDQFCGQAIQEQGIIIHQFLISLDKRVMRQ